MNHLTELLFSIISKKSVIAAIVFAVFLTLGNLLNKVIVAKYQSNLRLKEARENQRRKNLEKLASEISEIETWIRERDKRWHAGVARKIETSPIAKTKEIVETHFPKELGKEMRALVDAEVRYTTDLGLLLVKYRTQGKPVPIIESLENSMGWKQIYAARYDLLAAIGRLNAELPNR